SLAAFVFGPTPLGRLLRLRPARPRDGDGWPSPDGAAPRGYAAPSHLARDAGELAGLPLGELLGGPR
ncbi:AraC family transcriptional regulator, partial [Streptomyces scabiei]|nr:AraC family transcriptional regulator [Streptomyces scabiei]